MANYKTLTYGTTGEDVKKLQQSLNDQGANLDVDGIYGEKTRSAVRSYQEKNGLGVDGIAGSETLGHLYGTGLANTQDTQATTDPVAPQAAPSGTTPAVATRTVTPQVSTQRTPEQAWQDYLNREVFEDAMLLSGGETQRLMLARALYKNAPFIVLDEPTAALDPIAESEMYQKYNEMTSGKSSIYISHRLASTRFCDRIIMIADGGIGEEGTHEELLKAGGKYAELFEVQSKYYKEGEVENEEN